MKMRRWVIIEKHTNQDAVKYADCGHSATLILPSCRITPDKSASRRST
jgi:hypothetical protein